MEISYRFTIDSSTFPLEINEKNLFLDLNIFKQAGEKAHAYKLDIKYPDTWNVESSGNLNSIENQLSGRFELGTNQTFNIIWNNGN